MNIKLSVIILTFNESIHIERAIKNVIGWADKVIVLDSHSNDNTADKARALGAGVITRPFDNYKNQREYAVNYVKHNTDWLLFLDADEYISPALKVEIESAINDVTIDGYYLPRRFIFMEKWIKWGGYYPTYLLRLFRPEKAHIDREINEHVIVSGKTGYLKEYFVDHNLKGIHQWIAKHNQYADFEAKALFDFKGKTTFSLRIPSNQRERKQWLRNNIWNRLPIIFIRPLMYYLYRYFFRLGFLDGKAGFVYHFLQGFWFWFLIDVKYFELKKQNSCVE